MEVDVMCWPGNNVLAVQRFEGFSPVHQLQLKCVTVLCDIMDRRREKSVTMGLATYFLTMLRSQLEITASQPPLNLFKLANSRPNGCGCAFVGTCL